MTTIITVPCIESELGDVKATTIRIGKLCSPYIFEQSGDCNIVVIVVLFDDKDYQDDQKEISGICLRLGLLGTDISVSPTQLAEYPIKGSSDKKILWSIAISTKE